MLLAAVAFGGSYLLTKRLSDLVAPGVVVVMLSICVPIGLAPLAVSVWVPPSNADIKLHSKLDSKCNISNGNAGMKSFPPKNVIVGPAAEDQRP